MPGQGPLSCPWEGGHSGSRGAPSVASARTPLGKTFELVAERGQAPDDLDALFAALETDPPGSLDGVHDSANMPPESEPQRVLDDLEVLDQR